MIYGNVHLLWIEAWYCATNIQLYLCKFEVLYDNGFKCHLGELTWSIITCVVVVGINGSHWSSNHAP